VALETLDSGAPIPAAHRWLLAIVVGVVALEGWQGLSWGLPSEESWRLVLPDDGGASGSRRREAIARLLAQTARDAERKRLTSVTIPLADNARSDPDRWLAQDPVALARATRRFLTFPCDWDEPNVIRSLAMMRPGELDFNPRLYQYGALAIYPVGALIRAAIAVDLLPSPASFETYTHDPRAIRRVYMAGRTWTLLLVLAGIVAVWWAALRVGGPPIALLAALLFAIATPVQAWMVQLKPHMPAAAPVALCLGLAVRAARRASQRDLVASAACAALATSFVPTAGVSVLMVLAACVCAADRERSAARVARRALAPAAAFAGVYLLLNPYVVLDFAAVRAERAFYGAHFTVRPTLEGLAGVLRWQLANALPAPWLVLALAGVALGPRVPLVVAGAMVATNYLSLSLTLQGRVDHNMVRWFAPSLPAVAIWTALGFERLRERRPAIAGLLLATGAAWSLAIDLFYQCDRVRGATPAASQLAAGEWLARSLPAGSDVGTVFEAVPRQLPPMDLAAHRLRWIPNPDAVAAAGRLPEWFITTTATPPAAAYELAARFVDAAGPAHLTAVPHASPRRWPPFCDFSEHQIALAGVKLGHPVQLHQVPVYVYRKRPAGQEAASPRVIPAAASTDQNGAVGSRNR
jgi:hypothetical protein